MLSLNLGGARSAQSIGGTIGSNLRIPDPHWGDIRAFSEGNGTKNVLKF